MKHLASPTNHDRTQVNGGTSNVINNLNDETASSFMHTLPEPSAYTEGVNATNIMSFDQLNTSMLPPHSTPITNDNTQMMAVDLDSSDHNLSDRTQNTFGTFASSGTMPLNPVTNNLVSNSNTINCNIGSSCNTSISNYAGFNPAYYMTANNNNGVGNNYLNNTEMIGGSAELNNKLSYEKNSNGGDIKPAHVIYRSYFERDDDHLSEEFR